MSVTPKARVQIGVSVTCFLAILQLLRKLHFYFQIYVCTFNVFPQLLLTQSPTVFALINREKHKQKKNRKCSEITIKKQNINLEVHSLVNVKLRRGITIPQGEEVGPLLLFLWLSLAHVCNITTQSIRCAVFAFVYSPNLISIKYPMINRDLR